MRFFGVLLYLFTSLVLPILISTRIYTKMYEGYKVPVPFLFYELFIKFSFDFILSGISPNNIPNWMFVVVCAVWALTWQPINTFEGM